MQATQTNTVSSTGRLAGKVAIVTGSSRGIGAAIAKQLAADGAVVAVNYANSAEAAKAVVAEIEQSGGKAHAFQADVSVRAQVFDLVDQVIKRWGRLDVFVNNSGTFSAAPLADVAEDEVDRLLGVNYKGTLWGIQAASKVFLPAAPSSTSPALPPELLYRVWYGLTPTLYVTEQNFGAYAATKAAIDLLTKTAAKELGAKGIRVNGVSPGVIETDMSSALGDQGKAAMKAQTPLENRLGQPEEVAHVVAFLASPQASWVTGQNPELAGGV